MTGCTLGPAEMCERIGAWRTLLHEVATDTLFTDERHVSISVEGDADQIESLEALAALESVCCSFFRFGFRGDQVRSMTVEVPAGHESALDSFAGLALRGPEAGRGRRRAT